MSRQPFIKTSYNDTYKSAKHCFRWREFGIRETAIAHVSVKSCTQTSRRCVRMAKRGWTAASQVQDCEYMQIYYHHNIMQGVSRNELETVYPFLRMRNSLSRPTRRCISIQHVPKVRYRPYCSIFVTNKSI